MQLSYSYVLMLLFFFEILKKSSQSPAFDDYFNFAIRRIYLFNTIAKYVLLCVFIFMYIPEIVGIKTNAILTFKIPLFPSLPIYKRFLKKKKNK